MSRYQKKHPSTHTPPAHRPSLSASSIFHEPQHHPCSIHVLDNLSVQPLTVSSSAYLWVWSPLLHTPYTSSPILHTSSFRNTCPYHRSLFCCSSDIMSTIRSLSLNCFIEIHATHPPDHSHLCPLKCHIFLQARSHFHVTYYFVLHTLLHPIIIILSQHMPIPP